MELTLDSFIYKKSCEKIQPAHKGEAKKNQRCR